MNRLFLGIGVIVIAVVAVALLVPFFEAKPDAQTASVTAAVPPVSTSTDASSAIASSTVAGAGTMVTNSAAAVPMQFEIVTTPAAQQQGLGGRSVIPDNYAMLFVFPKDDTYGFWMKDMLAPIDMIWLADNGTIIKIDSSVPADSYPAVYYPPAPVKYVLETKAGFAIEHGWTIGTQVELPAPYGS